MTASLTEKLAAELERWFDSAREIARDWVDFKNEANTLLHLIRQHQAAPVADRHRMLDGRPIFGEDSPHDIGEYLDAACQKQPAAPDGWIDWHGGECPVPPDTVVQVVYRDSPEVIEGPILAKDASELWSGQNDGDDIIRYRIVRERGER